MVDDIEAGMKHWSEVMGVGPWFYNPRVPIEEFTYDGRTYEPHNSVALANSGEMQVELIQTRDDVPSIYLVSGGGGRDVFNGGPWGGLHGRRPGGRLAVRWHRPRRLRR